MPSLANENTQKAIRFIRGADAEKAKLEYAANPDNYDLSNVNFFPTAGNSELTRQNLSMLADLQNYQQEVELKPIGGSEDASGGSTGNQRGESSNSYQRTYTSSSGNTYVYARRCTAHLEHIIYIVEPHERSPAYIAAAPCGMATSCTVKVPGRIKPREIGAKAYVAGAVGKSKMQVAVALPGAVEAKAVKARAFTAGTVERSHTAINIVIGGQTT